MSGSPYYATIGSKMMKPIRSIFSIKPAFILMGRCLAAVLGVLIIWPTAIMASDTEQDRYNPDMKRFYKRLTGKGKPGKLALTAVMRKLIILANALIKQDRVWTEIKP